MDSVDKPTQDSTLLYKPTQDSTLLYKPTQDSTLLYKQYQRKPEMEEVMKGWSLIYSILIQDKVNAI